jgi:serine O-acetyltransferase
MINTINNIIKNDIYRYYEKDKLTLKERIFMPPELKMIITFRKTRYYNSKNSILKYYYKYKNTKLNRKYLSQLNYNTEIGKGLYIGHIGNIYINPKVMLGKNINIAQGVTIGQTNRGEKKGCPDIGNNVWIGANATIVGKIKIGDDVLIAPNSYVNIDIPSHSIVIGNPAQIHYRENATEGYINRKI